jgi:thioredoxin 1
MLTEFTQQSFDLANQNGIVLVEFTSTNCASCRHMIPTLEQLSQTFRHIIVGSIDIIKNLEIAGRYEVQNVPTILLLKNGMIKSAWVGVQSFETISEAIEELDE